MANIKTIKIDSTSIFAYKARLLKKFDFHPYRKDREYGLLKETIKLVGKGKAVLYLVTKGEAYLGAIALSVSSIEGLPSSQIDYLFVDYNYRKKAMLELQATVSGFLIMLAIQISEKIRKDIGLKYLVLYPDAQSDKLIKHYKETLNFSSLNDEWLFIKLQ